MFSNLKIAQKGLILVLVPVTLGLTAVIAFSWILSNELQLLNQLEHQQQVLLDLNRIGSAVARATILAVGGKEETSSFRASIADLTDLEERFHSSTDSGSDTVTSQLNETLNHAKLVKESVLRHAGTKRELEKTPSAENRRIRKSSRQSLFLALMEFSELSKKIVEYDNAIKLNQPKRDGGVKLWLLLAVIVAATIACGVSYAFFHFFTEDMLKRLRVISENSKRLATGEALLEELPGKDEIARLDHVIHDASEQLSDRRRQGLSILDNAVDIVCSLNEKLKFTAVNPAVATLWKYDQDEILGMSLVSLLEAQSSADNAHSDFERIATNDTGSGQIDTTIKCKNGAARDFQWTVKWLAENRTFSCVVHDISQQRELERLKQQFTLMVSHDLRSPLTALMLNLSMYLDNVHGDISDAQRVELTRAQSSTNRLMALINDLLDLGKLESGTMPVQAEKTRAYNICAEAIESMGSMASLARIKIDGPKNDGLMYGEERRLLQATINLLSNSIKFAPANSTIKIRINVLDELVEVRISDEGPGIPLEDRALIFDKFKQAQAKSNVNIQSSGLGLAIVKAIITAHGGILGVDSEEGKGSSFWYRIPKFTDPHNIDEDLE